jgi:hypothetical protein
MGSEEEDGAGKSLDALISAFRESPFAVFVPEKSSIGVFKEHSIRPASITLVSLSGFPDVIPNFFRYINTQISLYEYSHKDHITSPLSRVQFNMALSIQMPGDKKEYNYRLGRDHNQLPFDTYGGMTGRVLQMMPRLTRNFYAQIKNEPTKLPALIVPERRPRNPPYIGRGSSLVA